MSCNLNLLTEVINTANFKQDILNAVGNQAIEAVVITSTINYCYDPSSDYNTVDPRDGRVIPFIGTILTWEQAAPLLDYSYDRGFGSQDCHNVEVYTATNVYYIYEYDGGTSIHYVPRNPTAHKQEN